MRRLRTHPLSRKRGESVLKVKAWVDGASRGNPGPAGYGTYGEVEGGEIIEVAGWLGVTTNNVAEYAGLIEALTIARAAGATDVEIVSDSELLVKQMLGQYRVKHPNLIPLHQKARILANGFRRFSIRHTLRAGNKDADRLANLAVDRGEGRWEERRRSDAQP